MLANAPVAKRRLLHRALCHIADRECDNEGPQPNRHPGLQPEGDLSLSGQWQSLHIANPYEAQAELA